MSSPRLDARWVLPLRGVSYDFYTQLRREPANRPLRMTYHNGTLEIFSPQYRHEKYSSRIGLFVLAVTAGLGIPCQGAGSTTFSRRGERMRQGWGREPDQSFYLASESRIRDKEEINQSTSNLTRRLTSGSRSIIEEAREEAYRSTPASKFPRSGASA
ncbi:MAG: hypothetical protein ACLP7Q_19245 [Isosphaeraceae bacterium]